MKIYSENNKPREQADTLWRSLNLDPNEDLSVDMFIELFSKNPEQLQRLADIDGSWLITLKIAQHQTSEQSIRELYELALNTAFQTNSEKSKVKAMTLVSESLASKSKWDMILHIILPRFKIEEHGLRVSSIVFAAFLETKDLIKASELIEELYLAYEGLWDDIEAMERLLVKHKIAQRQGKIEQRIELITTKETAWLTPQLQADFNISKSLDSSAIAFLGCALEAPDGAMLMPTSTASSLARGLPLLLAEQFSLKSNARSTVLTPISGDMFALNPRQWNILETRGFDFMVQLLISFKRDSVDVRIVRCSDRSIAEEFSVKFDSNDYKGEAFDRFSSNLFDQVFRSIANQTSGISQQNEPEFYRLPVSTLDYLIALENLLVVRFASGFETMLNAERVMVRGWLNLSRNNPDNYIAMLIALQALNVMISLRPLVVFQFEAEILQLSDRAKNYRGPSETVLNAFGTQTVQLLEKWKHEIRVRLENSK